MVSNNSVIVRLLILALTAYSMTFLVASSSLLESFRAGVMARTPSLKFGNHKHFIECRMCVGFWCALAACNTDWRMVLPVYGLAYFMATQER